MLRIAALLLLSLAPAVGQVSYYPFTIDQDRLAGAPDFSWMNHPLTAADRLFVQDGHFFRLGEDQPERVRLFGVNFAFGANFPDPADATRIARRLRRLGINLVRLHHMDTQPDTNPNNAGSTLTLGGPYPTLNPVSIARLRGLLDALSAEGIYVNLNLHVGYTFRPAVDGVPALPGPASMASYSKPLNILWPRMIELQAEYARDLIDALRLNDDPVLGMVEIDNENSLLWAWQSNNLDSVLLGEYQAEAQRQWNAFLAARYSSTEALREAWGVTEPDGPDLLAGRSWTPEIHAPAQATYAIEDGGVLRIQVARGGAPVIFKQVGFSIATDTPYGAEVEMRADLPAGQSANVYWDVKQDVSPWRTESGKTVALTAEWQKFTMAFQPQFAMDRIGRFAVSVENVPGAVYVRNASLKPVGRRGLAAGETLEAGNVSLVPSSEMATGRRTGDYLLFLADRDRYFLDQVRQAVAERAGPLVPVTGTQMGYGGLLNLDSHADLDYLDNHFYVDHYGFPNVAWDGRDWYVRNQSSLGSGLAAFQSMAAAREFGRPYTVSEYNQPWPNIHGAEIDPTLAAFGAFQDWDAIVHFAYSHGRNWDAGVPNGFNLNGDWTKFPNAGQAAWLFRSGAIQAGGQALALPVSLDVRLRAGREKVNGGISDFLARALGYNAANAFLHPVGVMRSESDALPEAARAAPAGPFDADTGDFTYDRDGKLFLIHSELAAGLFGFPVGKVTAGAIDVELAPGARGFAAILLTALDGRPLADSGDLLLSTPGYALRSQPGADPPRPQQLVNYPNTTDRWTIEKDPAYPTKPSGDLNGGIAPTWMERVESRVTLRTAASGITVYPLDGSGARLDPLGAEDIESVEGGFRLHLQADGRAASPWYEIVADFGPR